MFIRLGFGPHQKHSKKEVPEVNSDTIQGEEDILANGPQGFQAQYLDHPDHKAEGSCSWVILVVKGSYYNGIAIPLDIAPFLFIPYLPTTFWFYFVSQHDSL